MERSIGGRSGPLDDYKESSVSSALGSQSKTDDYPTLKLLMGNAVYGHRNLGI